MYTRVVGVRDVMWPRVHSVCACVSAFERVSVCRRDVRANEEKEEEKEEENSNRIRI